MIRLCVYLTFWGYSTHHAWSSNLCSSNHPFHINQRYVAHFKTPMNSAAAAANGFGHILLCSHFRLCMVYFAMLSCMLSVPRADCTFFDRQAITVSAGHVLCGQIAQDVCSCKKIRDRPCTFFFRKDMQLFPPLFTTRR